MAELQPLAIADNWPDGELGAVPFRPLVNSGCQSNFPGHMSTQPTAVLQPSLQ